jgi:hypothetical protein
VECKRAGHPPNISKSVAVVRVIVVGHCVRPPCGRIYHGHSVLTNFNTCRYYVRLVAMSPIDSNNKAEVVLTDGVDTGFESS